MTTKLQRVLTGTKLKKKSSYGLEIERSTVAKSGCGRVRLGQATTMNRIGFDYNR